MAEAPRARPVPHKIVASARGHIRARPRDVFEVLDLRFSPGLDSRISYAADSRACLVIVQRGWSRAEYRVVADDQGSNVEFVLLDISRSQRERGRLTGARTIEQAPAEFERMLRQLRLHLE